ncbi:ribonuclease BN [Stanieria cyanosphaera PCC 7437]|uniref:Ribonuclease BN n=1 Tax=Stanieria cyanosphaera (strain ATCC 29371 / PCC 7437) TaxID=111780 RepID=K9XNA4_STAC7|nr:YihY/virulence factor BrkB family protein [Stanieria cyanosphaera]AFZ34018.1 ribonuclease BN [Stanieria cyanosphaera PCC 7437]
MSFKIIWRLLKETWQEWQDDNASRLAASLAYYTIFSLSPLLIIAISIAGAIFGEEAARGEIVGQIQGLVGTNGAEVIETAIQNANRPDISNIASTISIVVLLFGASGVFAELQEALNLIWEVKARPQQGIWGFIRKRILSFSVVLGIGFLLLVSLIISAVLSALSNYLNGLVPGVELIWQVVNFMISFVVTTILFALMYKFLPDVKIRWNDVWIGAIITSLLFSIGRFILGAYLGGGSFGSTYGAAGSLVIILAWVYYSTQILFFGAEFTQVYAKRYGSQIIPNKHAVPLNKSSE